MDKQVEFIIIGNCTIRISSIHSVVCASSPTHPCIRVYYANQVTPKEIFVANEIKMKEKYDELIKLLGKIKRID